MNLSELAREFVRSEYTHAELHSTGSADKRTYWIEHDGLWLSVQRQTALAAWLDAAATLPEATNAN